MTKDLLDSIEKVLNGEDAIPERVSNTLLLAGMRHVYRNQIPRSEFDKVLTWMEVCETRMDHIENRQKGWTVIASAVGGAIGSIVAFVKG